MNLRLRIFANKGEVEKEIFQRFDNEGTKDAKLRRRLFVYDGVKGEAEMRRFADEVRGAKCKARRVIWY